MDYNQTLNLPKTDFPMRAALPQREPEFLKAWEENDQYRQLMQHNEGKPLFVLHDGPPYANGDIHIGHAMNKTLKDFIVRYKNMTGFQSPYVPGWDTHGLPTELKARKQAGIGAGSDISDLELRKICRETALSYVDIQRESFKRLGVIGEWDHPYITLTKDFEEEQIKVFATMASQGHIYKGLKPVYWCPDCKTALAEAEIEYGEDPCHSIYVKFQVTDDMGKLTALGADLSKTYFVIWTTTTWTLPANVAICVGPNFEYSLVKSGDEFYVMATDLVDAAMADRGTTDYETVGVIQGSELEYMKTQHPFIDRTSLVIVGDHVTLESGTGCVHTAPGHGVDDFIVCQKYPEIPTVVPVDAEGRLTEEAGQFAGLTTDEANKPIAEHLEKIGALFALKKIVHQYPHCWRCHKPIIFRATSQWFCSVDDFKEAAVAATEDVQWYPAWGKDRMQSMIQERADWCISRQRKWVVPIPVFYCKDCGKEIVVKDLMLRVSKIFGQEGSDAWFAHEAEYFLPEDYKCPHCGAQKGFEKESDIMDVWFDSGAMPYAQLHYPFENKEIVDNRTYYPADFIAEGVDQTRGWFFTLHAIATMVFDSVAYKNVISNGLVLDKNGNKMSKRLGNAVDPFGAIEQYGSDPLRWYMITNSSPWDNLKFDTDGVDEVRRKFFGTLYNTYSFFALYANVDGFAYQEAEVPVNERPEIDRWIQSVLNSLVKNVDACYNDYEPTKAGRLITDFVNDNLSNWYVRLNRKRFWGNAMSQDKLSAYQTLYTCLETVARLMAPIAPFYADRLYTDLIAATGRDTVVSVHLAKFPECNEALIDGELEARMQMAQDVTSMVLALRRKVNIKVRQPLQCIMVPVVDEEQKMHIEAVKDLIMSEVNVKEIKFVDGAAGVLVKKVKCDFKKLGPKFGKQMKAVAAAVAGMSQEAIAELEKNGKYTFMLDGAETVIETTDVEIFSEDIPGWLVANEGKLTVALEVTVTEELRREGVARELVNRIQNIRKNSGFEITDKIKVALSKNPQTDDAVNEYNTYICNQVLANSLELVDEMKNGTELNFDDFSLYVSVVKE